MDDQLTLQILELLGTMQEACQELYTAAKMSRTVFFQQTAGDMELGLQTMLSLVQDKETVGNKRLIPMLQSILDTVRRVQGHYSKEREYCLKKIEFELLPLLQEAYGNYYFYQYVADHPEKLEEYYTIDKNRLFSNTYVDEAIQTGKFKYELSICVTGYNKLDYTKRCVKSLLQNIPEGLNYELILVNHGSNDGTKEYFESIRPHKQLDIAVNGGGLGSNARIAEGEFVLGISNDTIITPGAIENLLACIRSDPRIARAVPTTPNISNLQSIPAQYSTWEELVDFARKNNRLDPCRWEQRVRLCDPIAISRSSVARSAGGLCPNGWFYSHHPTHSNPFSFPDDRISLLLRRHGYKLMLVKNAYCHHFGSVTLKDEITKQNEQKYYAEGRQEFNHMFQVDPWGPGFCYDPVFIERVVEDETGHVEVLGINCGLGSNSLKIKEQIKEYSHNTDCALTNLTSEVRFLEDLRGISDEAALITSIKAFKNALYQRTFQYIVWELPFLEKYKFGTLLELCLEHLAPGGKLFIKLSEQSRASVRGSFPNRKELGNDWTVLEK